VITGCSGDKSVPVVVGPTLTEPEPTEPEVGDPEPVPLSGLAIALEPLLDGFEQPLFITSAKDGSGRLFVLEKGGLAWVVENGERTNVFLDLTDSVSTDSERGLLGMAFAPDFDESKIVYVNYTDLSGTTTISRFFVNGNDVDRDSEQKLLTIEQPYANHNGGMIAFGPDDDLYIGMGDGGSGGDPQGNGQNTGTLLGAMLRLNVMRDATETRDTEYGIPAGNPFADTDGARAEIWAYGLRNPWRFSFDRKTGDLWIGDVGQNKWEEIDFQPAGSTGGENYGWNRYEATHPYPPESQAAEGDFTAPVIEYDRDAGQSVTGGYVYRGSKYPDMWGTYFYGDFSSGSLWAARRSADGLMETRLMLDTGFSLVSFGEDDDGELYVVDFGGTVYKLVAK